MGEGGAPQNMTYKSYGCRNQAYSCPVDFASSANPAASANSYELGHLRYTAREIGTYGMGKVWERYRPVRKSFGFKYGGMAYRGRGDMSRKLTPL